MKKEQTKIFWPFFFILLLWVLCNISIRLTNTGDVANNINCSIYIWNRSIQQHRSSAGRRMSKRKKMVVLSAIEHIHIFSRSLDRIAMACLCLFVLSKRTGTIAKWSETKGTKSQSAGQTRVRRNFYDRSERLGWRIDIGSNNHRSNFGKFNTLQFPFRIAVNNFMWFTWLRCCGNRR